MPRIYSSQTNAVRTAIDAQQSEMAFFSRSVRNKLIRDCLVLAGKKWIGTFLPLRFTDYVTRQPFGYPKTLRKSLLYAKGRRMGLIEPICKDYLQGWDPWSRDRPPGRLVVAFKRANPGKYKNSITGLFGGLFRDMTAWAKQIVMRKLQQQQQAGAYVPLVESGMLRDTLAPQAHADATVTATRATLTVTIPSGDRQNSTANRILRLLPEWEFDKIVSDFTSALAAGIEDGRIATHLNKQATAARRQARIVATRATSLPPIRAGASAQARA